MWCCRRWIVVCSQDTLHLRETKIITANTCLQCHIAHMQVAMHPSRHLQSISNWTAANTGWIYSCGLQHLVTHIHIPTLVMLLCHNPSSTKLIHNPHCSLRHLHVVHACMHQPVSLPHTIEHRARTTAPQYSTANVFITQSVYSCWLSTKCTTCMRLNIS